jgi:hypothetical protein
MTELLNYPSWLKDVNECMSLLTMGFHSAEDFDYPWIESYLAGKSAKKAAEAALQADGYVIEQLPAPAMIAAAARNRSLGVK